MQDGEIPWRRKWQPTPIFLPGKFFMDRGAWWATVHGFAKEWHGDLATKNNIQGDPKGHFHREAFPTSASKQVSLTFTCIIYHCTFLLLDNICFPVWGSIFVSLLLPASSVRLKVLSCKGHVSLSFLFSTSFYPASIMLPGKLGSPIFFKCMNSIIFLWLP